MAPTPLPLASPLDDYGAQADQLLAAWRAGETWALDLFHHRHPRFLDERIPWLPKRVTHDDIRAAPLEEADARLAVARWYDFADWTALEAHVAAVIRPDSPTSRFERAVEAVIEGHLEVLAPLVEADPALVHARSARVTCFDPPMHRATLLHYVAANGVEGYRQKSPASAVDVARTLLGAGADPDALAGMYGGACTTMSMLVSSDHPARAGVQVALVDVLVEFGASVEAQGDGSWTSPLLTALTFGFLDAAEALVRRGARINTAAIAAGLNRPMELERLLPIADSEDRHRALALAAQLGHPGIVERLLDAGEDPNRYNPKAGHAHTTPLHQAVWRGHAPVVRLLVERGARLDLRDTIYKSTPLGWAVYGKRDEIAAYLRSRGAEP
jgi:ankyrin repeat protein